MVPVEPKDDQLDAMMAAQHLNLKTINGYSGANPGDFGAFAKKPNAINRINWINKSDFKQDYYIIK